MFRENSNQQSEIRIMDSNDLERERGITILAKNTAARTPSRLRPSRRYGVSLSCSGGSAAQMAADRALSCSADYVQGQEDQHH